MSVIFISKWADPMDLQEQKKRIIEQIDDYYSLNQIEQLLGTQLLQEPIVAYSADGHP